MSSKYIFLFYSNFQHKGLPYCHKPCYAANFGPKMMGYGSNVVSPANFRRGQHGTLYNGDYDFDLKKVYESPSPKAKNGAAPRDRRSLGEISTPKRGSFDDPQSNRNGNVQLKARPKSDNIVHNMNTSHSAMPPRIVEETANYSGDR